MSALLGTPEPGPQSDLVCCMDNIDHWDLPFHRSIASRIRVVLALPPLRMQAIRLPFH